MLAFTCDNCGQLVFFDNTECLACHAPLGVVPGSGLITIRPDDHDPSRYRRFTDPEGIWWRRCANAGRTLCNWLVPDTEAGDRCTSCELTRTLPNDSDLDAQRALTVTEEAKRRLLFQLDDLRLPIISRSVDPVQGLAFDLLSSRFTPVTTGHANGVITIDLAETDDAHREWLRRTMGEPYRTMLGHLRHEIGHYYWMLFSQDDPLVLARIRDEFGDDTIDYRGALDRHYSHGPPDGWQEHYVSNYASTHPWEDWAETFAHYLHIRGTLQTAATYGVFVEGPAALRNGAAAMRFKSDPAHAVANASFDAIMKDWVPLTYALNEINRAMGKDRLYPFVLRPKVIEKLSLVHDLVTAWAATRTTPGVPVPRWG